MKTITFDEHIELILQASKTLGRIQSLYFTRNTDKVRITRIHQHALRRYLRRLDIARIVHVPAIESENGNHLFFFGTMSPVKLSERKERVSLQDMFPNMRP